MPQRLIDHPRRFWTVVFLTLASIVISVAISVWAITTAKGAPDEAARRLARDTASSVLITCQTGNRTRPQLAINQMVGIDGILTLNPKITLDVRRQVAAAYIHALEPELAPGRSIGFRDCNDNGRIDRGDFLADEAPPAGWEKGVPDLLGPDSIPHVESP